METWRRELYAKEYYSRELYHYNHNHDPRTGRFASSAVGTYIRGSAQAVKDISERRKKATGTMNKLSETIGFGAAKTISENKARSARTMADRSKTKLFKHLRTVRAKNQEVNAAYYQRRRNMTIGARALNALFQYEYFNKPVTRLSGRTTTEGRDFVGRFMTFGIANLALDVRYLKGKRSTSTAEARRKEYISTSEAKGPKRTAKGDVVRGVSKAYDVSADIGTALGVKAPTKSIRRQSDVYRKEAARIDKEAEDMKRKRK